MQGTRITREEFDKLTDREGYGAAALFDHTCPPSCGCGMCGFGGFFEATLEGRSDIICISNNDGHFVRSREDLVKSKDGILVGFVEDGVPPEFEDVFEVREF